MDLIQNYYFCLCVFLPFLILCQNYDTKWTIIYLGVMVAEEKDIRQAPEFYKGWADGVFYSCDWLLVCNLQRSHNQRIS